MNYETMSTYDLNKLCLQRLGYTWQSRLRGLSGFLVNGDFSRGFTSEAEAWAMRQPATSVNDALWLLEGYNWQASHEKDHITGLYRVQITVVPGGSTIAYAYGDTFQLAAVYAFLRATEPEAVR